MTRDEWAAEVDKLLEEQYYIDLRGGAGMDEEQITREYETGWAPDEWVAWFADKYDLIDFSY